MAVVFVELDEAQVPITTYIRHEDGRIDFMKDKLERGPRAFGRRILNAFLPAGYPVSVTPDYLEYQIYDSLQAFSSSIAGLLSSRAVLEGIGVGDSQASPTAALLLSVLQESMGRIATILFAHKVGTALEPECKMYRLAADVFNDGAMVLDCLSPAFPRGYRVVLLSVSSVLRSLCGVAAGSAKASLSAHFATQGNLGELNAKDSSQETVISLLGMLVGTLVVSSISSQWATWTALIALLVIHLGTNYLAVRAVSMKILNRQRANLLFSTCFYDTVDEKELLKKTLPSPTQISAIERVFERDGALRWQGGPVLGYCEIGVPFSRTVNSLCGKELATVLEEFKDDAYILYYDEASNTYLVTLKDFATPLDQLHAWMHALFVAYKSKHAPTNIVEARSVLQSFSTSFLKAQLSKAGWDTETGALEVKSGTRLQTKSKQI